MTHQHDHQTWAAALWALAISIAIAAVVLLFAGLPARAQTHHHPTETITGEVGRFYETWMKPDVPTQSCCNRADCYATEARFVQGRWEARRREDGKWLRVPDQKVERNREMPDSRAHLCAPSPSIPYYPPDTVFCFGAGSGT